jgi:shikimate kinase
MRIYLTGFMGSGKSSVGKILAHRLGAPFLDLDHEIERQANQSIAGIFDQRGENSFREMERSALELFVMDPFVMATGGGAFIFNRDWMLKHGVVVFLDIPFEHLVQRIGADPQRPLWSNAKKLYEERLGEYRKAHFTIDAVGDPEIIAERIKNLIFRESQKNSES